MLAFKHLISRLVRDFGKRNYRHSARFSWYLMNQSCSEYNYHRHVLILVPVFFVIMKEGALRRGKLAPLVTSESLVSSQS
jgi:hypothetical protein